MSSVITENADIKTFFESKLCKDVVGVINDFVGKDKIELGEYIVYYLLNDKPQSKINVIKKTKKFISYKLIHEECPLKKYENKDYCEDPTIDLECDRCRRRREDKTFRKKIFIDKNDGIEYCKIDLDDGMGRDYWRIYANKK